MTVRTELVEVQFLEVPLSARNSIHHPSPEMSLAPHQPTAARAIFFVARFDGAQLLCGSR